MEKDQDKTREQLMSELEKMRQRFSVMKGDKKKTIQVGCDDYMSKPVDINEVLNKVAEMLETGK